jgi:glucose/arabinose dehydrogenase
MNTISRRRWLIPIFTTFFIMACASLLPQAELTPLQTYSPPTSTPGKAENSSTDTSLTPIIQCTPPACQTNESYHCPGDCPGGCGTICATHTPAPQNQIFQLPDPANYQWALIAEGLNQPVGLVDAGDDSGRLFIIEQPGAIRIHQYDELLNTPFLEIRQRVNDGSSEQGLLGLAFHPDYHQNGYFFVNYTAGGGDTVIARYRVSADPNLADPASEEIILTLKQPFGNHNGGHVAFGPDGYLFIGTGDGGSANDPQGNAQNLDTLLGKMLRINVDDLPYSIPSDNPFGDEIWAYGLRNPWRYSFDSLTGDLYLGDVGQGTWEEIDFLPASTMGGANFGWDLREGSHPFEGTVSEGLILVDPVAEYDHGSGCSVTGGEVYRGSMPEWQGVYIYGDYCSGLVWGLLQHSDGSWSNALLFETNTTISSFGIDQAGEVYLVDHGGQIFKLSEK